MVHLEVLEKVVTEKVAIVHQYTLDSLVQVEGIHLKLNKVRNLILAALALHFLVDRGCRLGFDRGLDISGHDLVGHFNTIAQNGCVF